MSKKDSTKNTKFVDINEVLRVLDKGTKRLEPPFKNTRQTRRRKTRRGRFRSRR